MTRDPSLFAQVRPAASGRPSVILLAMMWLYITVCSNGARAAQAELFSGPEAACVGSGGTYLGDMTCRLPDGSVTQIHSMNAPVATMASSTLVQPGTPHAWALATTAITFEFNGGRHDSLAGAAFTKESLEDGQTLLSDWWGVHSRDDLLQTLAWLQFEGHRSEFDELGRGVDAMSKAQFLRAKIALKADREELHRLEMARRYHHAFGARSILAWDLVRYVSICRWGYLAGYLSDQEAWDHIMSAALRLQQTFRSWKELENNFLTGREFWSLSQTKKTGDKFRAIADRFIHESNSPWNQNPWNLRLGVQTPLPVKAE
jgi:hypothetical protein